MAVRVLLVLAAFAVLYGCGQASSPVERQEEQVGVEEPKPKQGKEQATVKCADFISREAAQEYLDTHATEGDSKVIDPDDNGKACDEGAYLFASGAANAQSIASASAQASGSVVAGVTGDERAEQAEGSCRVATYASEENRSQQEANAFSERVADGIVDKFKDDPSLTVGPAQNAVLDDLGVPRYPECVGGEE
jgi:hypothetical protein